MELLLRAPAKSGTGRSDCGFCLLPVTLGRGEKKGAASAGRAVSERKNARSTDEEDGGELKGTHLICLGARACLWDPRIFKGCPQCAPTGTGTKVFLLLRYYVAASLRCAVTPWGLCCVQAAKYCVYFSGRPQQRLQVRPPNPPGGGLPHPPKRAPPPPRRQDRLAFMPNLARIKAAGAHFLNHAAVQPVCGPSRSSLLSGRLSVFAARRPLPRCSGASCLTPLHRAAHTPSQPAQHELRL